MLMDNSINNLCFICNKRKLVKDLTNIFDKPALLRLIEKTYGSNVIYNKKLPPNICLQCILQSNCILDNRRRTNLVIKEYQKEFLNNINNNNSNCVNYNHYVETVDYENKLEEIVEKTSAKLQKINKNIVKISKCSEEEKMRESELPPVKEHLLRHRRRNTICVEPKPKKVRCAQASVLNCDLGRKTNESPISKRKNFKEDLKASPISSFEENGSASIIAKRGRSKEQKIIISETVTDCQKPVKRENGAKKTKSIILTKKNTRLNKSKQISFQETVEDIDYNLENGFLRNGDNELDNKEENVDQLSNDNNETMEVTTGNIVFEPMFCRTENVLDTESGGNIHELNNKNTIRTEKLYSTTHNCQFCAKTYVRYRALEKHINKFHRRRKKGSSIYTLSTDGSNLSSQMNNMTQNSVSTWGIGLLEYKCHLCPEVFSMRRRLTTHIKTHRDTFTCTNCNKMKFNSLNDLEWHKAVCIAKMEAQSELTSEVAVLTPTPRVTRSKISKKTICYSEYDEDEDEDAASDITSYTNVTTSYKKKMNNIVQWVNAMKENKEEFMSSCYSVASSEDNDDLMSVTSDVTVNTNFTSASRIINKNYKSCLKQSKYGSSSTVSSKTDKSSVISQSSSTTGSTETRYFKQVLKNYQKFEHTYNRREFRRVCKRRRYLRRKSKAIAKHMYEKNGDETFVVCLICLKKFDNLKLLMHHEVYEHPGFGFIPYYRCLECGVRFTQDLYLCRHSFEHLASGPHCCIYCNAEFSIKIDLKIHIDLHHIKSYKCIYCDMSYLRNDDLYIHLTEYHNYRNENINFNNKSDKKKFINIINEFNKKTNTILIRKNYIKVKKKFLTKVNTKKNTMKNFNKINMRIQKKEKNLINNNYYNYNQNVINLCNLNDDDGYGSGRNRRTGMNLNRKILKIRRKCYNNYKLNYGTNDNELTKNINDNDNGISDYIYNGVNNCKSINKKTILFRNVTVSKCNSPLPFISDDNDENISDSNDDNDDVHNNNIDINDYVNNDSCVHNYNSIDDNDTINNEIITNNDEESVINSDSDSVCNNNNNNNSNIDNEKILIINNDDDEEDSLINNEFLQQADNNTLLNNTLTINDYNLFSINNLYDKEDLIQTVSSPKSQSDEHIYKKKRQLRRSSIISSIKRRASNNNNNYRTTTSNKINLYNYKRKSKHLLLTKKCLQTLYFNNFFNYNLTILPSYTQLINNDYYYFYN